MVDPAAPGERPRTMLESALSYDRTPVIVLLVLLPLISWMWIIVMARDMYGPMTGASVWMMTARWDLSYLLLLWAMWAVMMTGMMLPSASPTLLLFGVIARRSSRESAAGRIYTLAAGYLIVWTVFSLGATALQRVLAALLLVSPMMEATNPAVGATLLRRFPPMWGALSRSPRSGDRAARTTAAEAVAWSPQTQHAHR